MLGKGFTLSRVTILLAVFACQARAASTPPPSIEDLVGTWTVSSSMAGGSLETGEANKTKISETWIITTVDTDTVQISGLANRPFSSVYARYRYGLLFIGYFDDTDLYAHVGYLAVKGPKLQMKGEIIWCDVKEFNEAEDEMIKATKISNATSCLTMQSATFSMAGTKPQNATLASTPVPPPIEDLLETSWAVKLSGKAYNLQTGEPVRPTQQALWTLHEGPEPATLIIEQTFEDGSNEMLAIYMQGFMIIADAGSSDENPAPEATLSLFRVTGKSGAYKIRGPFVLYDLTGDDDVIGIGKCSGKQITP